MCGRAESIFANAAISPIWFLRGCRSPTDSTNGASSRSRSQTSRCAFSRPITRKSGFAALGITLTLSARNVVRPKDRVARKFAHGQHARRTPHGPLHRVAQLRPARPREVAGMFQKADVVYRHHYGCITPQRRRVLHVDQIGLIPAQQRSQFPAQPGPGVRRNMPDLETPRHPFSAPGSERYAKNSDSRSSSANARSRLRTYTSLPVRCRPIAWASTAKRIGLIQYIG